MRKNYVKLPLLIAALYFGGDLHAQSTQDTTAKENKIEEVVVIGYGTAKKVDLTSAIVSVKGDAVAKTPSSSAIQGLQGKAAGVQITSFGSPGDSPKINIRGQHSINGDNQPLYVVDGVFVDDIDFLTPNDIREFTILKDASASAIYGRKAANGVVVITTNGGSFNRKAKVSYSTYYGVQQAANVVKMANTEQFTNFALESGSAAEIASINAAIERFGRSRLNPNLPNVNTDWYKETLKVAPIQNHNLSVEGGSEKISYSLAGDYFNQEGILKMKNSYERFNIRAKIDAKATDWLNVGTSVVYTRSEKYDDEASAWSQIYYAVPVLPIYDYAYNTASPRPYADGQQLGYRDHLNPFSLLDNSDRLGERRRLVLSSYAEVNILPKELTFKSTFSYNNRADNERIVLLPYYVRNSFQRTVAQSSLTRINSVYENYIWDNVLTFNKTFNDHDFTLMGGSSFLDEYYSSFQVQGFFDPAGSFSRDNEKTWYLQNTAVDGRISSDTGSRFYGISYFGRLQYKFKDRYILYATLRNEGSNKFLQKRVNLPAVGASWIVSEESFLKDSNFINLLKFRVGWGRLANNQVDPNRLPTATTFSSVFDNQYLTGSRFSTYSDNVNWEFTEETNVGMDAEFLNRRLSVSGDYFIKDTKDMLLNVDPIIGVDVSRRSIAAMRNRGFEISAGWKDKIGENWGYSINGNFSRIKNEITDLGGVNYYNQGAPEFQQRFALGQAAWAFYGWEIDGVYQNQSEVNNDPSAAYANSLGAGTVKPGYFKYKDLNGDGKIDADDRTYLGSPLPTYYYGGSIAVNFKNWDLSLAFYGQGGNLILNRNRAEVIRTTGRNIDAELAINRWHGEGTTNEYVSSEGYRNSWNQRNSKFWLEKGDFFRLQNIQLGYTLKSANVPEMRFTITADRPYLWSKSKLLFNPEVGNNGVDLDIYPTPSVFSFGYSIKF